MLFSQSEGRGFSPCFDLRSRRIPIHTANDTRARPKRDTDLLILGDQNLGMGPCWSPSKTTQNSKNAHEPKTEGSKIISKAQETILKSQSIETNKQMPKPLGSRWSRNLREFLSSQLPRKNYVQKAQKIKAEIEQIKKSTKSTHKCDRAPRLHF